MPLLKMFTGQTKIPLGSTRNNASAPQTNHAKLAHIAHTLVTKVFAYQNPVRGLFEFPLSNLL